MESILRSNKIFFALLIATFVTTMFVFTDYIKAANARTEQLSDSSNNNLMISMEAPDNWNSGVISQTAASFNWRLNALDATNDDTSAIFIVVNLPSIFNLALPLGQKSGILSMLLSQYVTINGESDLTLSDGSSAHRYSISISPEQLHRLKAPIDKGYDGVLITTKQGSITYIIAYASELGRMSQFESTFQNILNSVKFGSVSFTATGFPSSPSFSSPDVNIINITNHTNPSGAEVQMIEATSAANVSGRIPEDTGGTSGKMTGGNATTMSSNMAGKMTGDINEVLSGGESVIIAPGSSTPNNGKDFVPRTLTVSLGTTVTWTNEDTVLHTVTSGKEGMGNNGNEFDSTFMDAGKTFQHTFNTAGTFDYYCALHPSMKGKIIVS